MTSFYFEKYPSLLLFTPLINPLYTTPHPSLPLPNPSLPLPHPSPTNRRMPRHPVTSHPHTQNGAQFQIPITSVDRGFWLGRAHLPVAIATNRVRNQLEIYNINKSPTTPKHMPTFHRSHGLQNPPRPYTQANALFCLGHALLDTLV